MPESLPSGMGIGELTGSPAELPLRPRSRAQLVYPNIYPIYELLEHLKGLVLHIQSCNMIQTTQSNNRVSSIDSVAEARSLVPDQRPTAMNICKLKICEQKGTLCDTL